MADNCYHTYREIIQQPFSWRKEYELLLEQREKIETFVSKYLDLGYEIVFTGAGTSAFIGDVLEVALCGTRFRAGVSVPTTDLITHPHAYLAPDKKMLLISFARSGNSPESLGAIKIANDICRDIAHIYITCNEEGELAKTANRDNTLMLVLPPETNDRSLAMTSSFSTMLFTCIAIADVWDLEKQRPFVDAVIDASEKALARYDKSIGRIAGLDFERAVFLGSGELKGIAEESCLKLQELTDGSVVCNYDSFLGFRHGPKAVINEKTLMVYLLSNNPAVRRYETDLVKQINSNNRLVAQIAISEERVEVPGVNFDLDVVLSAGREQGPYECIPYIFTAQLLGYYKSLDLKLDPDSPSVSGNISRVVEGVTIYYKQKYGEDRILA